MTNFDFEERLYIGLLKHCCQNIHDNITHKTVQLKYQCMLHLNSDKRKKASIFELLMKCKHIRTKGI